MSDKKTKLSVGLIDVALIKALKILIPFICAPYVSRKLGADNIGIYSYTNSIATYFCMIAALGTYSYGKREISRNRDNIEQRSKLFWEIEIVSVTTTVCTMLGWAIFLILVKENFIYFIILSISIIATLFDISWFFEGIEDYSFLLKVSLIVKVISVICIFIFVNDANDLPWYVLILALSLFGSNISMWFGLRKKVNRLELKSISLKNHYKETFVYFIPSIAISVYTILDKTFLGILGKDNYESGCYEQAQSIITMANGFAFSSITTVMGVRTSYYFMKNQVDDVKKLIDTSLDMIITISVGCMFGIAAASKNFVPIFFGEGFDKVVTLMIAFSPIMLIIGISDCLGGLYYSPVGKRKISARYVIIGAIANICFNIILIPYFKAVGAVIASIMAEFFITTLYVKNSCGFCTLKKVLSIGYKKIICGLVMSVCVFYIGELSFKPIFVLILQVLTGVMIYLLMLLLLRDTSPKLFICFFRGNIE